MPERRYAKILVTGGAGFIGAHYVRYLLETYRDVGVVTLDALTYAGDRSKLPGDEEPRHCFIHGDIRDTARVCEVLETHAIDCVIHFAAESHVDRSILGPLAFVETNVRGTFSLLEAVRQRPGVRLHHVSTDEIYGELTKDAPSFTEDSAIRPNSPYSATKASAGHLVRAYARTYGTDVTESNGSNTYGPNQHREKLIPTVLNAALRGERIPLYGDGSNIRDWLYVEDHCRAIDLIARRAESGASYNVGGGAECANIDLTRRICRLLDRRRPEHAPYEKLIELVADRPGHDFRYALDCGRIERELGWKPEETLDSGLARTVDWFLECAGRDDGTIGR